MQDSSVNLLFTRYRYRDGNYLSEEGVATIDASDAAKPKLASRLMWTNENDSYPWYDYYPSPLLGYVQSQKSTLRTDTA